MKTELSMPTNTPAAQLILLANLMEKPCRHDFDVGYRTDSEVGA
jgi:hypothetical protein